MAWDDEGNYVDGGEEWNYPSEWNPSNTGAGLTGPAYPGFNNSWGGAPSTAPGGGSPSPIPPPPAGNNYKYNAMGIITGMNQIPTTTSSGFSTYGGGMSTPSRSIPAGTTSGTQRQSATQSQLPQSSGTMQIPGPPELTLKQMPTFSYTPPSAPKFNTNVPKFSYTMPSAPGASSPIPQFNAPKFSSYTPEKGPTSYISTPEKVIPDFKAPGYDREQAGKYASKFSMPYVGEIRRAIRDAIVRTGSSTSPIQKKYQLGEIMNTSAEGLGKVMSQATQAGISQYNNEHARLLDAAKMDYGAKVNAINQSNSTQAQKDAQQFAAERDYAAQLNNIRAQESATQNAGLYNESMTNFNASMQGRQQEEARNAQKYGFESQAGYNTAMANYQAEARAQEEANNRAWQLYNTQLQTGYNTALTNYNAQTQGILNENQAQQTRNNQIYAAALAAFQKG